MGLSFEGCGGWWSRRELLPFVCPNRNEILLPAPPEDLKWVNQKTKETYPYTKGLNFVKRQTCGVIQKTLIKRMYRTKYNGSVQEKKQWG